MPAVFKYKHPCSYEYAPGYVNIGVDGEPGKRGVYGNAVYFTDFELDNSYNIELALQRIENNYVLSSLHIVQLKNRAYMVNDIILSNGGNCYRLIKSSSKSLFKNYRFDIEFLGKLHKSSFNNAVAVTAYDFTDSEILDADTGELLRTFPAQTFSAVPTNRVEADFMTTGFYNMSFSSDNGRGTTAKYFALYGIWLKFMVLGDKSDNVYYDSTTNTLGGVKYTLTIRLKNEKTLQGECGPGDDSGYNIYGDPVGINDGTSQAVLQTYIPMEFANLCVCDSAVAVDSYPATGIETEIDSNTKQLLSEIIWHDDNCPRKVPSYISDYSMDMLHPSGNNIKCTIDETRSMWRNSGKNHWGTKNYTERFGYRSYVRDGDLIKEAKYLESANPEYDYSSEISTTIYDDTRDILRNSADPNTNFDNIVTVDNFSEYTAGLGISAMNSDSMQRLLDNSEYFSQESHFIEGSKNPLGYKTTHPGESMFFSAIDCDNHDDIISAIRNYIFSEDNKFILTSKNNKTKECISNELTIKVNTEFRNKRIFVRCSGNTIISITVTNKQ